MLNREKIEELMHNHLICSEEEAVEALEFVRDLVEAYAEDLEENEPHATTTIRNMRETYRSLGDLLNEIE